MKKLLAAFAALTMLGLGLAAPVLAEAKIPNPPSNSMVHDPQDYLSAATEDEIDDLNESWGAGSEKFQMGVVFVDTLNGTPIEEYANDTARKWKIGYESTNNGALLVVALKDREFRIETSDNVATIVTDGAADYILEENTELMRDGRYNDAVLNIVKAVGDGYSKGEVEGYSEETSELLLMLIVIAVILLVVTKSDRGGMGPLLVGPMSSSSYRGSYRSSTRSSSRSFGRSGGGFGGGGASGRF